MPRKLRVPRLYYYSLEATFQLIIDVRIEPLRGFSRELPFDRFPSHIVTDLMEMAYIKKLQYGEENKKILFTPTVRKAILNWCASDFEVVRVRCCNVREIIIVINNYDRGVQRNVKLILGSPKITRIVFVNWTYEGMFEHSELGQLPTIFSWIFQENTNLFLMSKLPRLAESVSQTTEVYFDFSMPDCTHLQEILRNCPCIRVLRHSSLVPALYYLNRGQKNKPRYMLKNLDIEVKWYFSFSVSEAVKLCVEMCPEVSVVDFNLANTVALKELAEPLVSLDRLEVLCLRDLKESSTDLLQSILDKHGSSLLQLQTDIPEGLDVMNIFKACPNLRSLELSDQRFSTYSVPDLSREVFPNLIELSLKSQNSNAPSPLSKLLLSRSLTVVKLTNIKVEENVLDSVVQDGYWPNLTQFEASQSNNLKLQHVMSLLESSNDLARLSLKCCDELNRPQIVDIKKCIEDLNLNIYDDSYSES